MNPLYKMAFVCLTLALSSLYLSHKSDRVLTMRRDADHAIVMQMKTEETRGGGLTFEQQAEFDEQHKKLDAEYGSVIKLEQQTRTYKWGCILLITIGFVLGFAGMKDNRDKAQKQAEAQARA